MKNIKLIAFASLILVAGTFIYWKLAPSTSPSLQNTVRDKAIILDPKAKKDQYAQALVRLARRLDPIARQEATKLATDSTVLAREAAAEALGYFDDAESYELLQKLVKDQAPSVRSRAIMGVGYRFSEQREAFLLKLMESKDQSQADRLEAALALYRSTQKQDYKNKVMNLLVDMSEQGPAYVRTRALSYAASFNSQDKRLVQLFHNMLESPTSGEMLQLALEYLVLNQDAWLKDNISKSFDAAHDKQQKLLILKAFPNLCPKNRWAILEKAAKLDPKDINFFNSVIEVVMRINGPDALALLQRLSSMPDVSSAQKTAISAIVENMQSKPQASLCP